MHLICSLKSFLFHYFFPPSVQHRDSAFSLSHRHSLSLSPADWTVWLNLGWFGRPGWQALVRKHILHSFKRRRMGFCINSHYFPPPDPNCIILSWCQQSDSVTPLCTLPTYLSSQRAYGQDWGRWLERPLTPCAAGSDGCLTPAGTSLSVMKEAKNPHPRLNATLSAQAPFLKPGFSLTSAGIVLSANKLHLWGMMVVQVWVIVVLWLASSSFLSCRLMATDILACWMLEEWGAERPWALVSGKAYLTESVFGVAPVRFAQLLHGFLFKVPSRPVWKPFELWGEKTWGLAWV